MASDNKTSVDLCRLGKADKHFTKGQQHKAHKMAHSLANDETATPFVRVSAHHLLASLAKGEKSAQISLDNAKQICRAQGRVGEWEGDGLDVCRAVTDGKQKELSKWDGSGKAEGPWGGMIDDAHRAPPNDDNEQNEDEDSDGEDDGDGEDYDDNDEDQYSEGDYDPYAYWTSNKRQ